MKKLSHPTPTQQKAATVVAQQYARADRVAQIVMKFGELLREQRKAAGKTLRETADHLQVSVAYLSDVELDRRKPFKAHQVAKLADFFRSDKTSLLQAAVERRSVCTAGESSAPERIRRAIALMSQAREELMCDEVYEFLEDSSQSRAAVTGTEIGSLRLRLQLDLRQRGEKERLGDESLEGILKSREASRG